MEIYQTLENKSGSWESSSLQDKSTSMKSCSLPRLEERSYILKLLRVFTQHKRISMGE